MPFRFNHTDSHATPKYSDKAAGTLTYGAPQTAPEKPARKLGFAVDFAYTLNHAIVCTLTDPIIDAPVGATVQNLMASLRGSGEKITGKQVLHELSPSHVLGHFKDSVTFKKPEGARFSPATSWLAGEVAGDFGAVPVVVGLQHFAPGFMKALGKLAEPIAKPIFKRSAERTVRAEFKLAGMDDHAPEFQTRVDDMMRRELDDLPKAILWTGVSPAINITMQKLVMGSKAPVIDLLVAKAATSAVSSSLTLGVRASAPAHAQKWDDKIGEKAGKPISAVLSKILGVDKDEIKEGVKKRTEEHKGFDWKERIANGQNTTGHER